MTINRTLANQLRQADIITADSAVQLAQPDTPWWLHLLLGFAAWVASILIISSFSLFWMLSSNKERASSYRPRAIMEGLMKFIPSEIECGSPNSRQMDSPADMRS